MSNHAIPSGIDLILLDLLTSKILGVRFIYDGNSPIPPTFVTFTPDLTPEQVTQFDAIVEKVSADINFKNLPQWATWTAQEAEAFVNSNILGGLNQTQVDAQIDALPNTVAGMKTGLKQLAASILSIRSILQAIAKAIVYLRNLVISSN